MPLSDILSCSADQLEEAITHEEPYSLGEWYYAKGVTGIELCKLGVLLGVGSYSELHGAFDLVGEPLDEGPWPEKMHEGLLQRLASIEDDEIETVVPDWAKIEEFRGTWTAQVLTDYLKGLREFLIANEGPFFLINAL